MKNYPVRLVVDIGNTNTNFGVFLKNRLNKSFSIKTSTQQRRYRKHIKQILRRVQQDYPELTKVIVCSVVPYATRCFSQQAKSELKRKVILVGKDLKVPIKNKYSRPKQVGQDRLVGAYAASFLYGKPLIIIDLGTAITMDVVSPKGDYVGGIIIPGIELSLQVLFARAALLPLVEIKKPKNVIGQNTQESILSGIFWGYGSMINGLISQIKKELKIKPKIVLTGGHSKMMKTYLRYNAKIDMDLIMKGLNILGTNM